MKFLSCLATFLLTLISVSAPVNAQQEMLRERDMTKGQNAGELRRPFMRRHELKRVDRNAGQPNLREASAIRQADELKPVPDHGPGPGQGLERLSPEERQQIRRDINAAGRDIYRRYRPD